MLKQRDQNSSAAPNTRQTHYFHDQTHTNTHTHTYTHTHTLIHTQASTSPTPTPSPVCHDHPLTLPLLIPSCPHHAPIGQALYSFQPPLCSHQPPLHRWPRQQRSAAVWAGLGRSGACGCSQQRAGCGQRCHAPGRMCSPLCVCLCVCVCVDVCVCRWVCVWMGVCVCVWMGGWVRVRVSAPFNVCVCMR